MNAILLYRLLYGFGRFDQLLSGMADLVALEEKFGAHNALFVEDVGPWEGDSGEIIGAEFLSVHGLVADAVGVDGFAAFVGEQQVADAVLFGVAF